MTEQCALPCAPTESPCWPDAGLHAAVATALASEGISSGRGSGWALLAAEALPLPPITKSDAAFAAEGLEFVVGHETVSLAELNDLFERVPPPAGSVELLGLSICPCQAEEGTAKHVICSTFMLTRYSLWSLSKRKSGDGAV